jgi:hypothetical protein
MLDLSDLTPETLRRLYVNDLLPENVIAERYGTYQVKINRLRNKWGIPTVGKTGRRTAALPALTDRQRELVLGSLLGDGYMVAPSAATAAFCESHSIKQSAYLHWKGDILGPHVSSYSPTIKRDGDKVYHGERLTGVASTHMREWYDLFYPAPERKRVFPSDLYKRLTPLALAVWLMDDGGLMAHYHPRITFGLDPLSLKRAIRAIRRLGLTPKAQPDKCGTHTITFPGQDREFYSLVSPHVPDCMSYKLPSEDTPRRKVDLNAKQLIPERARVLYEGGLSLDDLASLYGVGRSTAKRRVLAGGATLRSQGRRSRTYSREAADEVLAAYSPKVWATLSETAKDKQVEEAFAVLRGTGFPAPLPLEDKKFNREVELVRLTSYRVENETLYPWSVSGNRACLPYFPNRYKAASRGKRTAYEAWHDDKVLRWAVRFQLDAGDPVLPHRVLRAVTMRHRTPGVFRPTVARWVYETYCPPGGSVWDPCSGYGGRLLGAFVAGVRYVATDVEPETVEGNRALAERLGCSRPSEVHKCPAERFDPGPVDLVFTSPPYFDREQYSDRGDQSWVSHGSDFDAWVEGFLRPVIATAYKRAPTLVLNVADIRRGSETIPLVARTIQTALEEGFSFRGRVWMPLARLNRSPEKAREPMLVFDREP